VRLDDLDDGVLDVIHPGEDSNAITAAYCFTGLATIALEAELFCVTSSTPCLPSDISLCSINVILSRSSCDSLMFFFGDARARVLIAGERLDDLDDMAKLLLQKMSSGPKS